MKQHLRRPHCSRPCASDRAPPPRVIGFWVCATLFGMFFLGDRAPRVVREASRSPAIAYDESSNAPPLRQPAHCPAVAGSIPTATSRRIRESRRQSPPRERNRARASRRSGRTVSRVYNPRRTGHTAFPSPTSNTRPVPDVSAQSVRIDRCRSEADAATITRRPCMPR